MNWIRPILCLLLPLTMAGADPSQPGPYAIQDRTTQLRNPGSRDSIPMRIIEPVRASGVTTPLPVVMVNHGFSLTKETLAGYGDHLASHGFFVVMPDRSGLHDSYRQTANLRYVLDWLEDEASFPGGLYYDWIDVSRVGMIGHSQGGKIAYQVAARDSRVKAVVGLDPVDTAFDGSVVPEMMPDVRAACLNLGTDAPRDLCVDPPNNYEAFYDHAPTPKMNVTILGGDHCSMMTTYPYCPCSEGSAPERTMEFCLGFSAAWFRRFLADDFTYGPYLWGSDLSQEIADGALAVQQDLAGADVLPTPTPTPTVTPTPQPTPAMGHIPVAGFGSSDLSSDLGGVLQVWVWHVDGRTVELTFDGVPVGVSLPAPEAPGLPSRTVPLGPGLMPGVVLLGLTSSAPTMSPWPYLTVHP